MEYVCLRSRLRGYKIDGESDDIFSCDNTLLIIVWSMSASVPGTVPHKWAMRAGHHMGRILRSIATDTGL